MDKSLVATILTGVLALASLVSISVIAALGESVPGVLETVLTLSVGAVIAAAGIATATRTNA